MGTVHESGLCDSGGVQDGTVCRAIASFHIDNVKGFA